MIKIAICDDELSAVQTLDSKITGYMKRKSLDYTTTKFLSGEGLLSELADQKSTFDAVFLDIQMNRANGISVAKAIRKTDLATIIVFVTALKEYVFDAFDVNAMHYLLKPIADEKLFAVLDKIVAAVCSSQKEFLVIHKGGEVRKIAFCDIQYCEVVNHRVFVYENRRTSEFGGKIESLEKEMSDSFFRCNRSYIVNLQYVDRYKEGIAFLPGGERIPIATRRQADFMKALLLFKRKEVR